jgi:hypothetical protein
MPIASIKNSNPANERVRVLVRALSYISLLSQTLLPSNNKCHRIVSEYGHVYGKRKFRLPFAIATSLYRMKQKSRQSPTKAPEK